MGWPLWKRPQSGKHYRVDMSEFRLGQPLTADRAQAILRRSDEAARAQLPLDLEYLSKKTGEDKIRRGGAVSFEMVQVAIEQPRYIWGALVYYVPEAVSQPLALWSYHSPEDDVLVPIVTMALSKSDAADYTFVVSTNEIGPQEGVIYRMHTDGQLYWHRRDISLFLESCAELTGEQVFAVDIASRLMPFNEAVDTVLSEHPGLNGESRSPPRHAIHFRHAMMFMIYLQELYNDLAVRLARDLGIHPDLHDGGKDNGRTPVRAGRTFTAWTPVARQGQCSVLRHF